MLVAVSALPRAAALTGRSAGLIPQMAGVLGAGLVRGENAPERRWKPLGSDRHRYLDRQADRAGTVRRLDAESVRPRGEAPGVKGQTEWRP